VVVDGMEDAFVDTWSSSVLETQAVHISSFSSSYVVACVSQAYSK
jgi:hypothetical protein